MTQQLRTSPDTSDRTRRAPAALTLLHGGRAEAALPDPALERARAHALRDRHAEGLTRLLSERDSLSMSSTGCRAALTAPQPSCPITSSTLTLRWHTAYISEPCVEDLAIPDPTQ